MSARLVPGELHMSTPQTLYLLASEHKFRLVGTGEAGLVALGGKSSEDFPDVDYRFPPERLSRGVGVKTGVAAPVKVAEPQRNRLAHHAMAAVEVQWAKGGYDRIVLVSRETMLDDLRHAVPRSIATFVAAELDKDLVRASLHDLEGQLAAV
jgi:Bacterial archaeo-eukaryotic release factor family 12